MRKILTIKNVVILVALVIFTTFLVSCGCNSADLPVYDDYQAELKTEQIDYIGTTVSSTVKPLESLDEEAKYNVLSSINSKIVALKTDLASRAYDEWNLAIDQCLADVKTVENIQVVTNTTGNDVVNTALGQTIESAKSKLINYLNDLSEATDLEDHSQKLIDASISKFSQKLDSATSANPNGETYSTYTDADLEQATDVYQIFQYYVLQSSVYQSQPMPIQFYGFDNGFWSHLFNNFFVFPIAWLIVAISQLFGSYYVIGLFIVTLIIRTLGWPIYARSNDMQLKMQLMQPELEKLQAKYATRKDPDSQRMMQYEQMKLYKRYKIGIGGCLLPLAQFPIFMSMFRAISRLPYTNAETSAACGTKDMVSNLNTKVFGIDLFQTRGVTWSWQFWGIIILVILVVGTQLLSQWFMQRKQKEAQRKSQENVPEYRRQAAAQQSSTAGTMKFMLYFMTFMMGTFVFTSAAGLGLYWLIGNLYSLLQSLLNTKLSEKRMEKLRAQHNDF